METNKPIADYLDRVMVYADRPEEEAAEVRAELEDHLVTKATELEEAGQSAVDATFDAVRQAGPADVVGYGLRKFRWLDVRTKGTARGFIAVGPRAVGVIACGGVALGVVTFAGAGVGLVSVCGVALSLLFAFGGVAIAPVGLAFGGLALGLIAVGGATAGILSLGGVATGLFADGGMTATYWTFEQAPAWMRFVTKLLGNKWLFGSITVGSWILWAILFVAMMALQQREVRRIRAGDPEFSQ